MATADPTRKPAPPTRVARPKRGSETAMDMVRSLGLIAAVIAVTLVFVPSLIHPGKSDQVQPVDYSDYVSGFHQLTGKTALTPTPVPTGWRANAGALSGPKAVEHLHIGFAVPGTKYAGLEESVAPTAQAIQSILGDRAATLLGHVTLNGASWEHRTSSRGEYSLDRRVHGITVIVTGSASPTQLQAFAASLH